MAKYISILWFDSIFYEYIVEFGVGRDGFLVIDDFSQQPQGYQHMHLLLVFGIDVFI